MITLIFIFISVVMGLILIYAFKNVYLLKKSIKEKDSIIRSARAARDELQKELQRLQLIEYEGRQKIEEINHTANNGIADILNDQLSDSGSKS